MKNKNNIYLVLTKYEEKKKHKILASQNILYQSFINMKFEIFSKSKKEYMKFNQFVHCMGLC